MAAGRLGPLGSLGAGFGQLGRPFPAPAPAGGGGGFDADAAAYFTRAGITDSAFKTAVNDLIVAIKAGTSSAHLSDVMDGLIILSNESDTCMLKNAAQDDFHLTPDGAGTFTQYRGYVGKLLIDYVPSTDKLVLAQDSAHLGLHCRTARSSSDGFGNCGCASGTNHSLYLYLNYFNKFYAALNASDSPASGYGVFNNTGGYWLANRSAGSGAGCVQLDRNGTEFTAEADASVGLPTVQMAIGGIYNGTAVGEPTTDEHLLMHWGRSLTAPERAAIADAVADFVTAIGA